jgi:hypothetical protein
VKDADQRNAPLSVREAAEQELAAEAFRSAVEAEKQRLKLRKPLWHRLVPFRITIHRRDK